jgi:hypothetical protein
MGLLGGGMKTFDGYYGIDDDYGIIGYGYQCPYCEHYNNFVDEDDTEQECSNCEEVATREG